MKLKNLRLRWRGYGVNSYHESGGRVQVTSKTCQWIPEWSRGRFLAGIYVWLVVEASTRYLLGVVVTHRRFTPTPSSYILVEDGDLNTEEQRHRPIPIPIPAAELFTWKLSPLVAGSWYRIVQVHGFQKHSFVSYCFLSAPSTTELKLLKEKFKKKIGIQNSL